MTDTTTPALTREQLYDCRNAILDKWGASDYREVFAHVNPFQLINALDDAIGAVWACARADELDGGQR